MPRPAPWIGGAAALLSFACADEPVAVPIEPAPGERSLFVLVETLEDDAQVQDRVLSLTAISLDPPPTGDLVTHPRDFSDARVTALYFERTLDELGVAPGDIDVPHLDARHRRPPGPDRAFVAGQGGGQFTEWIGVTEDDPWRDVGWPMPDPCLSLAETDELLLGSQSNLLGLVPLDGQGLLALVATTSTRSLYLIRSRDDAEALSWRNTDFGPAESLARLDDGSVWLGDAVGRVGRVDVQDGAAQVSGSWVSDRLVSDIAGRNPVDHFVVDQHGGLFRSTVDGYEPEAPPRDTTAANSYLVSAGPGHAVAGGTYGHVVRWQGDGPIWRPEDDFGLAEVTLVDHAEELGEFIAVFRDRKVTFYQDVGSGWRELDLEPEDSVNDPGATGRAYGFLEDGPNVFIGSHLSLLQLAPQVVDVMGRVEVRSKCRSAAALGVGASPIRHIVRFGEWLALGGLDFGSAPGQEQATVRFVRLE